MIALIVDDDKYLRETLSSYLKKSDKVTEVVHAADGKDALFKLANQEFSIILLDNLMPVCSGIEVIERLVNDRRYAGNKKTPIVFMSGNMASDDAKKAIGLGVKHILVKPFLSEDVNGKLAMIFG